MMYAEYDWTSVCYRVRFGDSFISLANSERSWPTKSALDGALRTHRLRRGKRTDSRTWEVLLLDTDSKLDAFADEMKAICATIKASVSRGLREIAKARAIREKLREGDYGELCFCPSERLMEAFNERGLPLI